MNLQHSLLSAVLVGWLASPGCNEASSSRGPGANAPASSTAVVDMAAAATGGRGSRRAGSENRDTARQELRPPERVEPKPAATAELLPPRDAAGVIDATFDDIKFDMEKTEQFKRSMLTPKINAMSGQPIRIRGWMLPTFRSRGLKEFVLVRDNQECCFGPGAALFDCILVKMSPGKTVEYPGNKQIAIEGVFRVEEFKLGEQTLAIYQMTGETMN